MSIFDPNIEEGITDQLKKDFISHVNTPGFIGDTLDIEVTPHNLLLSNSSAIPIHIGFDQTDFLRRWGITNINSMYGTPLIIRQVSPQLLQGWCVDSQIMADTIHLYSSVRNINLRCNELHIYSNVELDGCNIRANRITIQTSKWDEIGKRLENCNITCQQLVVRGVTQFNIHMFTTTYGIEVKSVVVFKSVIRPIFVFARVGKGANHTYSLLYPAQIDRSGERINVTDKILSTISMRMDDKITRDGKEWVWDRV